MALHTDEIEKLISLDTHSKKYFQGVYPSDRLPLKISKPCGIVVNLDKAKEPGSHWVAIWIPEQGPSIYFDSFGLPPLSNDIVSYLNYFGPWDSNIKSYQSMESNVCGYYAILFLILSYRGFSLDKIKFLFKTKFKYINDQLVKDYIKYVLLFMNKLTIKN